MKTFEYRLYPNKKQYALLIQCLRESRVLYNEMLEITKQQYEESGTFPTKYDLTAHFKGRSGEHVPATTVQCLADRLSKALKRFLAHICPFCSFVADRDVNAAQNILSKAGARPSDAMHPDGDVGPRSLSF